MLVLLLACFRVVRKCCLLLLLPCQKVEPSCLTKSILFQWFQYSSRSSKMNFLAFIWNGCLSNKWFSIPMYIKWMIWNLKSFGIIPKKIHCEKAFTINERVFFYDKIELHFFRYEMVFQASIYWSNEPYRYFLLLILNRDF